MMNFTHKMKLNEKTDGDGGGAEPAAPAAAPVTDQLGNAVPTAKELGYDEEPEVPEKKADEKVPDKKDEKKADEKSATGYEDEPPKLEDKKVEDDKKEITKEEEIDLGYELKVDEVIPKDEIKAVKEFAKKHKLPKEAIQEYLDTQSKNLKDYKAALAEQDKTVERQKVEQRIAWHKELKDDPNFGGEKFGANVKLANRVLDEMMPSTKKVLTERGSVLPPYVMRDLVKMGERLFETDKLQQGAPPAAPKQEKQESPLDYYNS